MQSVSKRARCATKKCGTGVSIDIAATPTNRSGDWQFQCPGCKFWNLASAENAVQATSLTQFDLERLPPSLRLSWQVKRSPSGGI